MVPILKDEAKGIVSRTLGFKIFSLCVPIISSRRR